MPKNIKGKRKMDLQKAFAEIESHDIKINCFWKNGYVYNVQVDGTTKKTKCSKIKFLQEYMLLTPIKIGL